MPTFLTEYDDPEAGKHAGPYVVAADFTEAETICRRLIMQPDGVPVRVVGELGESIPFDLDMAQLQRLQQQVRREVDAIVKTPPRTPADEAAWRRLWEAE